MIRIIFLYVAVIPALFFSCSEKHKMDTSTKYTKAQKAMNCLLKDSKLDLSLNEIIVKYFYNSEEILNGENFIFYPGLYKNALDIVRTPNKERINYYWNDEIDELDYFSWANDSVECRENLIIFDSSDLLKAEYGCFCFNEDGKILSIMPLLDPNTGDIIWLR